MLFLQYIPQEIPCLQLPRQEFGLYTMIFLKYTELLQLKNIFRIYILKLLLKYIRNKCFLKQKSRF